MVKAIKYCDCWAVELLMNGQGCNAPIFCPRTTYYGKVRKNVTYLVFLTGLSGSRNGFQLQERLV